MIAVILYSKDANMKCLALTLTIAFALCANRADAQTLTTLLQFSGTAGTAIGKYPESSLTVSGATLYGMTAHGGVNGNGNIFSVGTDGSNYRNLLSFTGTGGAVSGSVPVGNLTLSGSTLFGTTIVGGASGIGNMFAVGTNGANYQNLVSFTGGFGTATGAGPRGSLTLAGTTLYGTAQDGSGRNLGVIFSVGISGADYQDLVSFTGAGGSAWGAYPLGGLTLGGTSLYGMTSENGGQGYGNVFSVGTNGTNYHNLLSFTGSGSSGTASGLNPFGDGALTLSGTTLYGMTIYGGANGYGNIFSVGANGANYNNLLSFTGSGGTANGADPAGSLTLSGTTFYGTTEFGGTRGFGNVFSVGIDGSQYDDLYNFTGFSDGGYPLEDLTLSGGTLFGTTSRGGIQPLSNGYGTVFALTLPSPTPEPGTVALVGAAAVAIVSYRWRSFAIGRRDVSVPPSPQRARP